MGTPLSSPYLFLWPTVSIVTVRSSYLQPIPSLANYICILYVLHVFVSAYNNSDGVFIGGNWEVYLLLYIFEKLNLYVNIIEFYILSVYRIQW